MLCPLVIQTIGEEDGRAVSPSNNTFGDKGSTRHKLILLILIKWPSCITQALCQHVYWGLR